MATTLVAWKSGRQCLAFWVVLCPAAIEVMSRVSQAIANYCKKGRCSLKLEGLPRDTGEGMALSYLGVTPGALA